MAKTVAFSRPLGKTLQEMARQHRGYVASTDTPQPRTNSAFVAIAKTPSGGIPARSSDIYGKATCTYWYLNNDDELAESSESTEEVYNPYFFDIPGSFFIDVEREVFSGRSIAKLRGGFAGKVATQITARSGTTVGSGTVTLYHLVGTTLTSLSKTPTVYNTSQQVGEVDTYVQVKIDATGRLLWDVDDCPV